VTKNRGELAAGVPALGGALGVADLSDIGLENFCTKAELPVEVSAALPASTAHCFGGSGTTALCKGAAGVLFSPSSMQELLG
jgi:hypothetical protein